MGIPLTPFAVRFRSKVPDLPASECWPWAGTVHRNGYPMFHLKTEAGWKTVWAHRLAFELARRPLLPGETIDHLCRNPRCVNPKHLDAVSIGENSRRSPFTLTGANVRKTHCPQGHAYVEHGFKDQGKRKCRICVRARNRRAHHRRRAERLSPQEPAGQSI